MEVLGKNRGNIPQAEAAADEKGKSVEKGLHIEQMRYFFVDYENVHTDGFKGMKLVQKGDIVVVLYSENSSNLSEEAAQMLLDKTGAVRCVQALVGSKDALDFQLASYLGYTIGRQTKRDIQYFIVSRDKGYDKLCAFWLLRGVSVRRISDLSGLNQPAAEEQIKSAVHPTLAAPKAKKEQGEDDAPPDKAEGLEEAEDSEITREELIDCHVPEKYLEELLRIVNEDDTKQQIHEDMTHVWRPTKKTVDVYRKIRPLLRKKGKK